MHLPALTLLLTSFAALTTALPSEDALKADPLAPRANCDKKACKCTGVSNPGIYCGWCPQVTSGWNVDHAYECATNGKCEDYGCVISARKVKCKSSDGMIGVRRVIAGRGGGRVMGGISGREKIMETGVWGDGAGEFHIFYTLSRTLFWHGFKDSLVVGRRTRKCESMPRGWRDTDWELIFQSRFFRRCESSDARIPTFI
ncbi:uncharacterized protein CC84DRAFT_763029 [Paraphaeosphaeria sporulosa]|uniref:Uncharacterized protein n=1 Tax=Paraphaeosphaeria sporulosa TaxID=1460663 RepID=A0A177CHQ7_9PLEO|nr:uncharacterized protein CC84DRAFT_763029 [Paraphaeosphaeria sporulosa]OAG06389.1 hypothetical protein CC84DRAFT_763029 [Paraphaeosphaeria sporulosa]